MKWISVEDRVPMIINNRYNVVLDTDDGRHVLSMWYLGDGNWYFDDYGDIGMATFEPSWYSSVTHWMPLPEPPKED